jgi:hypothetical protein
LGTKKTIKHRGGLLFISATTSAQTCHSGRKKGSHDSYLWLRVNRGVAPDLFVCVVYATFVGSKHKNEFMFQNLAINIVKVQKSKGHNIIGRGF